MDLYEVGPLSPDGVDWFEAQTKKYIEEYYNVLTDNLDPQSNRYLNELDIHVESHNDYWFKEQLRLLEEVQSIVYNATVAIEVVDMDPPYVASRGDRREIVEGNDEAGMASTTSNTGTRLQITYNQRMTYRNNTMDEGQAMNDDYVLFLEDKDTIANLIQEPFNTITKRDTYIQYLKDPTGPADVISIFEYLNSNEGDDGKGVVISTTAIIVAGTVGGAFLTITGIVLFMLWSRKRRTNEGDTRDLDSHENISDTNLSM